MNDDLREKTSLKNVFIIGAKSIGQYGGYETFLDKLTEVHQNEKDIQYYVLVFNGETFKLVYYYHRFHPIFLVPSRLASEIM